MSVEHHTLTHRREFTHPREVVYGAWSDPALKRRWFDFSDDPDAEWSMDFRTGGVEAFRSAPGAQPRSTYEGRYHDIVEHERIVLAAEITLDGRRSSVALSTAEFASTATGSVVTVTEQITFLDDLEGPSSRSGGTATQLARLADLLEHPHG